MGHNQCISLISQLVKYEDTAEFINQYFCNIGPTLAEKQQLLPGNYPVSAATKELEAENNEAPGNEQEKLVSRRDFC